MRGSPDSRFVDDLAPPVRAGDLDRAAEKALRSAQATGRAEARLLDIADDDTARLAQGVMLSMRNAHTGAAP